MTHATSVSAIEALASDTPPPGMQALHRGLVVLDLIASLPHPRFTVLAEASGLPKGTLHRILQTLVEQRYARLDARDQSYRLGPRLFELAHRVWDQFDLRGAAEPELVRLRDLTRESARLCILDESQVLCVDQRTAQRQVRVANGVGERAFARMSTFGLAIAAHLGPSDRQALFRAGSATSPETTTLPAGAELDQLLNVIKARGYAVSVDEQEDGLSIVAAPILDHCAAPLGAIGVVAPSHRLDEQALHALGREVMEAARRIAGHVGEVVMTLNTNPRPNEHEMSAARCVIPGRDFLGEGPFWDAEDKRLHWIDILAPAILSGDPETGLREVRPMSELVSCIVPRTRGGFVCATESGIKLIDAQGGTSVLCAPEGDLPGNRFNDGKCDSRGRLWVGSLAIDTTPDQGALWRIDADGTAVRMEAGLQIANGLGWSPDDRRMYFTDSGKRTIWVYDFDSEEGTITNRRSLVVLADGSGLPDGLAIDVEGCIWSAGWDAWSIIRYLPDGRVDRVIRLPVPRPTSVAFGGDDMRTLFITTARIRLPAATLAEAPLSGSVLAIDAGVAGLPVAKFAG